MDNSEVTKHLEAAGVKPTPNRLLVMKELLEAESPLSLAYLEGKLYPTDKASIFRVLELFAKKDMIHVINDGSRSLKYEACPSGHHSVDDQHVHFYCEKCERVYCLEDTPIPHIDLPEGFRVRSANYVLRGLCPKCAAKS